MVSTRSERDDGSHSEAKPRTIDRTLNAIEVVGNKLPDPAVLFVICLLVVRGLSALLSGVAFTELDPWTGEPTVVNNLLTGTALASFLSTERHHGGSASLSGCG